MNPRLAALGLVLLALLGAGVTFIVHRAEVEARQARLAAAAEQEFGTIRLRLSQYIALLDGARAYVVSLDGQQTPGSYATYIRSLRIREDYAGLQGIGIAEVGTDAELDARLAQFHGAGYRVWPESAEDLRTAIVVLEPLDARNRAALGFDMYSEANRRDAMLRARAEGAAAISAPVTLKQEITTDQQPGVLIYLPLTLGREVRGFVYAPLRMGDFVTAALADSDAQLAITIDDITSGAPQPLYRPRGAQSQGEGDVHVATFRQGGRDWRFTARSGVPAPRLGFFAPITGLAFLLLTLTAVFAVMAELRAREHDRSLIAARQRASDEKDLLLREMSHRMKNALARVTAIARQSVRHAATKEELAETLTARLRAMARAQDLLTRAGGEALDLRRLLQAEIEQIAGDGGDMARLSGPMVPLSERQTQALGLVAHELATNALKYGVGAGGGQIDVRWSVEPRPGALVLELIWDERTGRPARPAEQPGFGTRLIDSLVEGELGGSIRRDFHATGLTVRVAIPLETA